MSKLGTVTLLSYAKISLMFQPNLNFDFTPPKEKEGKPTGVTFYLENFLKDEAAEERERRLHDYLSLLKVSFEDEENYIDHGGIAKVYSFGPRQICIKIMKDRHLSPYRDMYDLGNRPVEEFTIMEQLHGFSKGGIRSPVAEALIESGESVAIIMERLDAVNLQHILNGTEKMPKNFDQKKFFDSLDEYLNGLHTEMGVAHLDLDPRNIMVDRKTGEAYVIDFGRSSFLHKLSGEDRKIKIDKDWDKYDALYLVLEKFVSGQEVSPEVISTRNEVHQFGKLTKTHYSKKVNAQAHKVAEGLLSNKKEIVNIPLGEARNDLFVTTNKDLVTGLQHFVLHGTDFYIGVKK